MARIPAWRSSRRASCSAPKRPGLADTPLAERVDARHRNWAQHLPEEPGELWATLGAFDSDSRDALFAHCVSLTVNAVQDAYNRRPKAIVHSDRLAEAVSLDMVAAGWSPTANNYFGRVPKARILQAGTRGEGRTRGRAHRRFEKGGDGGGGRATARRNRLVAGSRCAPRQPGSAPLKLSVNLRPKQTMDRSSLWMTSLPVAPATALDPSGSEALAAE